MSESACRLERDKKHSLGAINGFAQIVRQTDFLEAIAGGLSELQNEQPEVKGLDQPRHLVRVGATH